MSDRNNNLGDQILGALGVLVVAALGGFGARIGWLMADLWWSR